jgi:hypothetical protein
MIKNIWKKWEELYLSLACRYFLGTICTTTGEPLAGLQILTDTFSWSSSALPTRAYRKQHKTTCYTPAGLESPGQPDKGHTLGDQVCRTKPCSVPLCSGLCWYGGTVSQETGALNSYRARGTRQWFQRLLGPQRLPGAITARGAKQECRGALNAMQDGDEVGVQAGQNRYVAQIRVSQFFNSQHK